MRRAFKIAQTGRPGAVLVDVTKDVTAATVDYTPMTPEIIQRQVDTIDQHDIEAVLQVIKESGKPMIFVGGGAVLSGAEAELREFARKTDAPVTDTLMGKGAFDGTDDTYTGMLGMHGTKTANLSVTECDLLLVLGARFSDRVTGNAEKFASRAKIVHIDIDPAEINKNIQVDYSIIGDLKSVLEILNKKLEQQYHKPWMDKVRARKEALPMTYSSDGLTAHMWLSVYQNLQIMRQSSQQMSDSIRCGRPSIINTVHRDSCLLPEVWEQWDTASALVSALNWEDRKRQLSTLPATAVSV